MRRYLMTFFGLLALFLVGCSGSQTPSSQETGRATLTIRWPEPGRLIPFAANSIRVELSRAGQGLGTALLVRPSGGGSATATFERLPTGAAIVTATAYPQTSGAGVAQASASVPVTILANQSVPVRLTMASTIASLSVVPAAPRLSVGQSVGLTTTARNASGEAVLISPSTLQFSSGAPGIASVNAFGVVVGVSAGVSRLTVVETESGTSATVDVTVDSGGSGATMYVSSFHSDNIQRFDTATGTFRDSFIPAGSGGLRLPHQVLFGPNNLVWVSTGEDGVFRFRADTGAFVDHLISTGSGGLLNACGIIFAPDGTLLVCSAGTNEIKRYDSQTGAYLGNFASGNGLALPHNLVYGADGLLYVASNQSDGIKRYNPSSGAFIDDFVPSGSGGLQEANDLAFGPGGDLFVTSYVTHEVKRYDGVTGAFEGNFVTAGSGGLDNPVGLAFAPDGDLYVASIRNHQIKRYNGQTGAYLGDVDPGNAAGLVHPWDILFR